MKRLSFVLTAVLALFVNACEKHSAVETASALHASDEHGAHDVHVTPQEGASHSRVSGEVHANPAPHAPVAVPTNPAGSGPTAPHDPALDKGTGGENTGAYKYFPEGGKK